MYLDKLDGRVDEEFSDKMSAEWREEQNRLPAKRSHGMKPPSSLTWKRGVQVLELARNAQRLFETTGGAPKKRRLLNFVPSNCMWVDGEGGRHFSSTI